MPVSNKDTLRLQSRNNFETRDLSIYLSLLSRSISDHHLRCGGWLNLEFSKREKHSGQERVSRLTGTDRNGLLWIPKRTFWVPKRTGTDRNGLSWIPKRTFWVPKRTETDFPGYRNGLSGYRNRLSGYRNGL